MQKSLRESGLKRFWSAVKSSTTNSSSSQCDQDTTESSVEEAKPLSNCSLPLLQVWPSSDSPRGEADGQSFVFPPCADDALSQHSICCENGLRTHHSDSGIESSQVSPSPCTTYPRAPSPITSSPTTSVRRPSSALLHPDHARIFRPSQPIPSPDQTSIEDVSDNGHGSPSSSTTSSLTSIAAPPTGSRSSRSDPSDSRRRSSSVTVRYSLFDALDLEYALLRAAARGSVGPYSLSESLHKLTFTQSLAFPALARGLANKRSRSQQNNSSRPLNPSESGLNTFAKVVTALVLVLVSVLVFAVVYKFVRT
ncbi:uncharacterized protein [Onthophagus taurus]|uniref:uncharacterized protein n=1 Tax=Onthophagus taurus TaxID=166361 RepID=UPI000C203A9A|nr:uncharacterized protein LOC111419652 [Onthophagus taurus]XP_022908269.1 uncharacterized protein LOC111419652 [Onthophagus taurus]XP_022908277.1 uncharacterized protein LOC111419652 [Onthophagus taurus]XP_022908283.1 uncharacterized protein LOC111419652 [Onthophagus taurus]XP_022908289.1 uncharacterized protein LOC111419652 [Onthophagus taurus]XP_022908296.1 uncharacterized protein LOC111419652 [Onthophagus taurus]